MKRPAKSGRKGSAVEGAVQKPPGWVLWAVAVSGPIALLVERWITHAVFPPDMEEVRGFLEPKLAPVAWGLLGLAAVVSLGGRAIVTRLERRAATAASGKPPDDDATRVRKATEALYLGTTLVQLPGLLATLLETFGAPALPTVLAVIVSAVGVIAAGARRR